VHFIGVNIEFSIFKIVFKVKIVKLSAQRDMKTLVKYLLSLPGLDSSKISAGLKVPPLHVLSTEHEQEATQMRETLEKYGAICEMENTEAVQHQKHVSEQVQVVPAKKSFFGENKWFLILVVAVLLFVSVISYFFGYSKYDIRVAQIQVEAGNFMANPTGWIGRTISDPAGLIDRIVVKDSTGKEDNGEALNSQINRDLKKALIKNPYNDSAWKALYEKLEKEGDAAGAKAARESYERAVRAQHVLSNLARGLGEVHVEIRENAVYYSINKELTDSEFYAEAVKLKKSLNSRFPGKDLILENHASKTAQSVTMKAE